MNTHLKYALASLALLLSVAAYSQPQPRTIRFTLNRASFRSIIPNFQDSAVKALGIASQVLSSQEFKDSLLTHSFTCRNRPATACDCGSNDEKCQGRITGAQIYEMLLRDSLITLDLSIVRASPKAQFIDRSYGYSCPCKRVITSYKWWLHNGKLPMSEYYAAHLAHEFTHIAGFNHGKQPLADDAAYVVGNIVEHILERRRRH